MRFVFLTLLFLITYTACAPESPSDSDLQAYSQFFGLVESDVVSCASTYFVPTATNDSDRAIVYYRTIEGQQDVRLWYSDTSDSDFEKFKPLITTETNLLSGFMGSFEISKTIGTIILTLTVGDELHYCEPIHLNSTTQSTAINSSISVSQPISTTPTFKWEESLIDPSSIYFQLITIKGEPKAISATYTYETNFTFYDLSNVVFNVTDSLNPTLQSGLEHEIILMSVSDDNWVTEIGRLEFTPI